MFYLKSIELYVKLMLQSKTLIKLLIFTLLLFIVILESVLSFTNVIELPILRCICTGLVPAGNLLIPPLIML